MSMAKSIIYNVTIKISADVAAEWKKWMINIHIPDVMRTGIFQSYSFNRLLFQDDSEGLTYAIQYVCDSLSDLQKYQSVYAPALQIEHSTRYKDKYVAFRSVLEVEKAGA